MELAFHEEFSLKAKLGKTGNTKKKIRSDGDAAVEVAVLIYIR